MTEPDSRSKSAVPRILLTSSGNSHHTHQVIAGFILLARKKEIKLRIEWAASNSMLPSKAWLLANVDGIAVAYDMDDGDILPPDRVDSFVENVDVLFRRGQPFQPSDEYRTAAKHRPLGLNYHATLFDKYFFVAGFGSNIGLRRLGAMALVPRDRATRFRSGDVASDDGSILFQTRLWDPATQKFGDTGKARWRSRDRESLNEERVALVRALKDEFGSRFRGGLAPTDYAKSIAPDLVLPKEDVSPKRFLQAARSARICVTSRGLWNSNGWKLAEFLGLGRTIVCERLLQVVPGMRLGYEYEDFSSPREAIAAIRDLDANESRIRTMRVAARRFFDDYVEPQSLVRRSLDSLKS